MTLYRQLLILIAVLFMVLFASLYLAKLNNTRSFLENQLESHATDTATSLGLSITPYMAGNDLSTVETMINAIFDHGFYRIIRLANLHGETILERRLDVVVQDVPSWFIRAVPLRLPQAEALITSGWNQVGFLQVESHPGYAYRSLWKIAIDMAEIFLVVGLLIAILGAVGLHLLLRPLRKVEEQAEALCNRQYTFQDRLPKTRELRRVVVAMNGMTNKVKQMFEDHVQTADQLRQNAYTDTLTGLGNRRFLESEVQAEMQQEERTPKGAFFLVEVHHLQELNRTHGYEFGDAVLIKVGRILKEVAERYENSGVARLSGGGFAIIIPEIAPQEAGLAAAAISGGLHSLARAEPELDSNVGHVGCACYSKAIDLGSLLAASDTLLRGAQATGENGWKLEVMAEESSSLVPQGEMAWRNTLEAALRGKKFILFGQVVASRLEPLEPLYLEIFSRIPMEDGALHSAGVFIPLAERMGNVAAIDRIMLEKILALDPAAMRSPNIAANLSLATLKDDQFVAWLLAELSIRKNRPRIIFEFAEYGLSKELPLILEFAVKIRELGCDLGIDHFGKGFVNFGYLQSLRPEYVKIDRAFTTDLWAENNDSRFFISALTGVARSLDIRVIVEGVENQHQFERLAALNVDGFQGYFIDSPSQV